MISVCMAVYNGRVYLEEQLRSILSQLDPEDEIIIVDDGSIDDSVALIESLSDERISVLRNERNLGPAQSFAKAIHRAKGNYIFLADQDDVWLDGKVTAVLAEFRRAKCLAVVTDAVVVDEQRRPLAKSLYALRGSAPGFGRNLWKNGFVGCCMTFRADVKSFIHPFPKSINMHDEWIGLCCSVAGRVSFIQQAFIEYRRHDATATLLSRGTLFHMAKKRFVYLVLILARLPTILGWRWHEQRSIGIE